MSWFDRFRGRKQRGTPGPSAAGIDELRQFLETRTGVEAFIEPPTPVYAMSLCLVAADGESMRRPVKDARQANGLASRYGVPVYDARIVGYPRRMRDYDRGTPSREIRLDELPPLDTLEAGERGDVDED